MFGGVWGCFGMFVAGAGDLSIGERVVGGWSGSVREASAVPIYRAFKFLPPATPLFFVVSDSFWPISASFSSFFSHSLSIMMVLFLFYLFYSIL